MARINRPDDYEDLLLHHLMKRPHDILAGWIIVAALGIALGAFTGLGLSPSLRSIGAALTGRTDEAGLLDGARPLADDILMMRRPDR